jgi:hypothetical protein
MVARWRKFLSDDKSTGTKMLYVKTVKEMFPRLVMKIKICLTEDWIFHKKFNNPRASSPGTWRIHSLVMRRMVKQRD